MRTVDDEISDLESGEIDRKRRHSKTRNIVHAEHRARIERHEIANVGKNASLAKHMFADLGVAIGDMLDKTSEPYVDRFLEISEMYETLTDIDDSTGIKLRNKIGALMLEIEGNTDFYFMWKITRIKVGDKSIYNAVSQERKIVI